MHADLGKLFHIHLVGVRHPVGVRPDDRRCDDLEHEPVVRRALFVPEAQVEMVLDGAFPLGDVRRVRLSEKEGVVCVPVELYVAEYIGEKLGQIGIFKAAARIARFVSFILATSGVLIIPCNRPSCTAGENEP